MGTERKGRTETLVGLFLFAGLAVLATLVVIFGRVGQSLSAPYEVTILFPNANGLAKEADVLLSGAKIGFISATPQLVGDSYRVAVRLKIQGDVHIPRKSKFLVGSANLLGDKFVDVVPAAEIDPGDFWTPGEIIDGSKSGGFDELTVKGTEVMIELADSLKELKAITANIKQNILNEKNTQNIQQTFENLKDSTASFKKTAQSFDQVVSKVDSAFAKADSAFADVKVTAERASKAADSFQKLAKNAVDGKGALGTLIQDKETGDNLRSLISNLRRSGILFYKDRPLPPEEPKSR